MKAQVTQIRYTDWRLQMQHSDQVRLSRLEQRVARDGDDAVLSDDQRLIVFLMRMLDEGGQQTSYVRELADAE